jgi:L-iditol 2-dehydrogenase
MDGCACEYYAINPWNLHKIPDSIDDVSAALIEPLAVGMGSVHRAGDVKGANVAVIGAGIIGNFTAQCAKALGAEKVIISDIIPQKLKLAEECGIVPVNAKETTLKDAIEKEFGSFRKADVIIDCAASKGSFASALEAARRSSKIVFTGNYKDTVDFEVPAIQRSEISMIGHMMYVKEDYTESIRCLSEGLIHTQGCVTQHFALNEYHKAFEFADEHPADVVKMMIDIQ